MNKNKLFKSVRKENTFLKHGLKNPKEYDVWLKIDQQSFCVTPYSDATKKTGEWYRDQLTVALVRLINQHKK